MKNKAQIREEVLLKLHDFAVDEKKRQTVEVSPKLVLSQKFITAQTVGLYMNIEFEFDLTNLFKSCIMSNKKIFVPKTFPGRKMRFIELETPCSPISEQPQLKRGKLGIMEPQWGRTGIPDLIVVPGLAWNSAGYRIGFGGGYYDRYLSDFGGHTVSLIYDFQRVEFLPEAHDTAVEEVFSV